MANSALALRDIDAYYGDSHVLQQVSFALGEGRLLGLLGRNGAGKIDLHERQRRAVAAARAAPSKCSAQPVTRLPPELIAARGVALVPQGRRVFKSLTVRENLMVAARRRSAGAPPCAVDARDRVRHVPAPRRAPQPARRRICPAASSRCSPSAAR